MGIVTIGKGAALPDTQMQVIREEILGIEERIAVLDANEKTFVEALSLTDKDIAERQQALQREAAQVQLIRQRIASMRLIAQRPANAQAYAAAQAAIAADEQWLAQYEQKDAGRVQAGETLRAIEAQRQEIQECLDATRIERIELGQRKNDLENRAVVLSRQCGEAIYADIVEYIEELRRALEEAERAAPERLSRWPTLVERLRNRTHIPLPMSPTEEVVLKWLEFMDLLERRGPMVEIRIGGEDLLSSFAIAKETWAILVSPGAIPMQASERRVVSQEGRAHLFTQIRSRSERMLTFLQQRRH